MLQMGANADNQSDIKINNIDENKIFIILFGNYGTCYIVPIVV